MHALLLLLCITYTLLSMIDAQCTTLNNSFTLNNVTPLFINMNISTDVQQDINKLIFVETHNLSTFKLDYVIYTDKQLDISLTYDESTLHLTIAHLVASNAISMTNMAYLYPFVAMHPNKYSLLTALGLWSVVHATCVIDGYITWTIPATYKTQATNKNGEWSILQTASPIISPTTRFPTSAPTRPTRAPTKTPLTKKPTAPTKSPTDNPTRNPSTNPSRNPSRNPTVNPSRNPTVNPSRNPTVNPTASPTLPFIAYINEFSFRGVTTSDDRMEIVVHRNVDVSKLSLSIYQEIVEGEMYLLKGFVNNTFPQYVNSSGWTVGSSYCNGNIVLLWKNFMEDILKNTAFNFAMGLTYNGVNILFVGNNNFLTTMNGPFLNQIPTLISVFNNNSPGSAPPNGTSNSMQGTGSSVSHFSFVGPPPQATFGIANNGQQFVIGSFYGRY